MTSNPGGLSASGSTSPIVLTGLTNGTPYTFAVSATNSAGTGPASAPSNSTIPQATQTITFLNPGPQNFGASPTLRASASSQLPVTFTSSTTAVCTVTTPGTLTFVSPGACTVNADQPGNASFLAAPTVTQTFAVGAVVPGAPSITGVEPGNAQATVSFTPPAFNGGSPITSYAVTSSPGVILAVGPASPITITGLDNKTAYTFTVTATNDVGTGPASAPSSSVTPLAPTPIGVNQSVNVSTSAPATLHVTANAQRGPFTAIQIVSPPSSGTALVLGLNILYLPDPTLTSTQTVTFTYTLSNASGPSDPITVTVTVTPSSRKVSSAEPQTPFLWQHAPPLLDRAPVLAGGAA